MKQKPVIVDANILFSALLRQDSSFSATILGTDHQFFICEAIIAELFKHKEKIVRLSKLSDEDVVHLFYILLKRVSVFKEVLIEPSIRRRAYDLCKNIDEADTPHVALTLHLNGLLWTGDKKLKAGLRGLGREFFFEPERL